MQGFCIKNPPAPVPVTNSRSDCGSFDGQVSGYKFVPRQNFGGYDIPQPGVTRGTRFGDIANLKNDCDHNAQCKGWNSYGDLKSQVEPLNSKRWHVWGGFSECEVRYIRVMVLCAVSFLLRCTY